jgi:hypothetical protein
MGFFDFSRAGKSWRGEFLPKRLLLPDETRTMRDEAGLAVWVFVGLCMNINRYSAVQAPVCGKTNKLL